MHKTSTAGIEVHNSVTVTECLLSGVAVCIAPPIVLLLIIKRNVNVFSLNAIVDIRLRCRHEMILFEYLGNH